MPRLPRTSVRSVRWHIWPQGYQNCYCDWISNPYATTVWMRNEHLCRDVNQKENGAQNEHHLMLSYIKGDSQDTWGLWTKYQVRSCKKLLSPRGTRALSCCRRHIVFMLGKVRNSTYQCDFSVVCLPCLRWQNQDVLSSVGCWCESIATTCSAYGYISRHSIWYEGKVWFTYEIHLNQNDKGLAAFSRMH